MGNIRGIFPRSNPYKVNAISDIASLGNINIIALSESHLCDSIYDSKISIVNFTSHRADRQDRSHGGVITYIKNDCPSTKVLEFSNGKCELVGVLLEKNDTLVINCYRPPDCCSESESFNECLDKIQLCMNDNSKDASNIILCGDFNFDFI